MLQYYNIYLGAQNALKMANVQIKASKRIAYGRIMPEKCERNAKPHIQVEVFLMSDWFLRVFVSFDNVNVWAEADFKFLSTGGESFTVFVCVPPAIG